MYYYYYYYYSLALHALARFSAETMSWKEIPIAVLQKRVSDWELTFRAPDVGWNGKPFKIKKGCLVPAGGKREDGYAQLKIRHNNKQQWAPRAYEVLLFVNGIEKEDGQDISHICGRGARGCCNIDHLNVESHAINISRKRTVHCVVKTECPHCHSEFEVFSCAGHGDEPDCV